MKNLNSIKVLCAGSFTKDIYIKTNKNNLNFNTDITHCPSLNTEINFGGCAANIAYGLHLNNINVHLCGNLKDKDYLEYLNNLNIKLIGNSYDKDIDYYAIIADEEKHRLTFFHRGEGNNTININEADLREFDYVIISGDHFKNMQMLKSKCLNLNLAHFIDIGGETFNLNSNQIIELCQGADGAFFNKNEIAAAARNGVSLDRIISLCKLTLVTLGKKGAECYLNGQKYFSESVRVEYVDETGCGDAFRAGFLINLFKSKSIKDCLKNGNEFASKCLQHVGGQNH